MEKISEGYVQRCLQRLSHSFASATVCNGRQSLFACVECTRGPLLIRHIDNIWPVPIGPCDYLWHQRLPMMSLEEISAIWRGVKSVIQSTRISRAIQFFSVFDLINKWYLLSQCDCNFTYVYFTLKRVWLTTKYTRMPWRIGLRDPDGLNQFCQPL